MKARTFALILIVLCLVGGMSYAKPEPALVELVGTDLKGGAAELFGSFFYGEWQVNYVYAEPTGGRSKMAATFDLKSVPTQPVFLHVKGRDDNGDGQCDITIELNGQPLFSGPNEFSDKEFEVRRFAIPTSALKPGENTLTFRNIEKEGRVGMPPWFQVARCIVAPEDYVIVRDLSKDFWIEMPEKRRPFPEPLAAGQKPGFAMRGTKGWMWTPEQMLAEIPVLAKYGMNFFQNCYGSMMDIEHYPFGHPEVNRWWEDVPSEKKAAYEKIVRLCQRYDIEFCFSMNPNLWSKRALSYTSDKDIDDLWKHYSWMQGLGVKWFNISLDDISHGIDASGQSRVVNIIFKRLKEKDPDARMIFCPTFYWGDGTDTAAKAYLEIVAKELDKDVYLFWTGDSVVGNITRKAAETFKRISGHRLFLWDNYPVNDAHPTMHLGPVINRDPDLCEAVDGYMSNPLCSQNEWNRLPLLTCADYAYNPYAYDPMRSIGQAILHLGRTPEEREVLKQVVEVYPGFVIWGRPSTGLNPVRDQFNKIIAMPHSRYIAEAYVSKLESLADSADRVFPDRCKAERQTIRNDIAYVKGLLEARYGD